MNSPELHLPQQPHPHQLNAEILPGAPDTVETPDVVVLHNQKYAQAPIAEPLPVLIYVICGFGIFLLGTSFAGFNFLYQKYDQGPGEGVVQALQPTGPAPSESLAELGKKTFSQCTSCHGSNGAGAPGQYPPLAGSPYVIGPKDRLIGILVHGLQSDLNMLGGHYNGQMAAYPQLNDKKLAALLTYIRSSWGNSADAISPEEVTATRAKLTAHQDSYTQSQLDAMK